MATGAGNQKVSKAWSAAWRSVGVLGFAAGWMGDVLVPGWWWMVWGGLSALLIGFPPSLWMDGKLLTGAIRTESNEGYVLCKPSKEYPEQESWRYMGFIDKEIE